MVIEPSVIWGAAGAMFGTGGAWAALKSGMLWKAGREDREIIRLRGDVKVLRTELAACEERHQHLEARIVGLEQAQDSHMARWVRDASKRLMWVNPKALIAIFAPLGYTREDLEGKTFAELDRFDQRAVEEMDQLDEAALAQDGTAYASLVKLHPMLPLMCIVKIAAVGHAGELIYEGYAYRSNDPEIQHGVGVARQRKAIAQSSDRVVDHPRAKRHRRRPRARGADNAPEA